jgi:hypothetical protein
MNASVTGWPVSNPSAAAAEQGFVRTGEMKVRIKQNLLPCFLPVIAVLCFVFLSPSFAEFKKVNECELARASASLMGQPAAATSADEAECNADDIYAAITAGGAPSANWGDFFPAHDDYGYDWLQNLKAVGDLYYEAPAASSPVTVEAGESNGRYAPPGATYTRIGLGSQEVGLDSRDFNVTLGSKAAAIAGQDQILGSLYLDGLSVKSNGSSYVTLYKTDGQMGTSVNVDVTIDRIGLATLSWGDADGFPGAGNTGKAGYVGLKDTNIYGVTVSGGPLSLEAATDDIGGKQELSITKFTHMGIHNLNVGMSSLDTTVVLGDKKDFSGTKYVLGTLYMKDLALTNVGGHLDIYNSADKDIATTLDLELKVPSLTLDTLSWGDSDGVGGTTTAGFVGLRNLAIDNLAIAGRVTVEVVTVHAGDTGIDLLPVGTAFVRMGFKNLDVSMDSLNTDVALGNRKDNLNQVLGSVYLGGLEMDINGNVDIHTPTASTQGIVLDLNVNFSKLTVKALSWGDKDGLGGMNTAGYRGWRNLAINGLTLAGRVSIEVATVDSKVIPLSADAQMFATYAANTLSPTFVHIGIGTGNSNDDLADPRTLVIGIGTLTRDIVLDSSKSLDSPNAGVLRSVYWSGFSVRANGWVNIGAH